MPAYSFMQLLLQAAALPPKPPVRAEHPGIRSCCFTNALYGVGVVPASTAARAVTTMATNRKKAQANSTQCINNHGRKRHKDDVAAVVATKKQLEDTQSWQHWWQFDRSLSCISWRHCCCRWCCFATGMVLSFDRSYLFINPAILPATADTGRRNDLHHQVLPIEELLPYAGQRPIQLTLCHTQHATMFPLGQQLDSTFRAKCLLLSATNLKALDEGDAREHAGMNNQLVAMLLNRPGTHIDTIAKA